MDDFWIKKAHKYITEHNAYTDVSDIILTDKSKAAEITTNVSIGLPSKFIKDGKTTLGVKCKEAVRFIFPEEFPLKAPKILLRDDFPRCFPHINPSETVVSPCIYEGSLSELLQQSEWMNGILNQLVDWLEKAAANDLLNYDQGWEPMRNDNYVGIIVYDTDEVVNTFAVKRVSDYAKQIKFEVRKDKIFTEPLCDKDKGRKAHALFFLAPAIVDRYVPNTINDLNQLYSYAQSVGIRNLREIVEKFDNDNIDENKIFIILAVKRPVNLIGSETNIEFLNFIIHKHDQRCKKKRKLKRVVPNCKVETLVHMMDKSPALLQRLSGIKINNHDKKYISLVGCGSLGSKIGLHLARNGNSPFHCIDDKIFMPHNNARHALTNTNTIDKAELLAIALGDLNNTKCKSSPTTALKADFRDSRIIIDTTASLSVRHFFMGKADLPPILSGGLYWNGKYGLLLIENKTKTACLSDIWAHLYILSLYNFSLRKMLFSSELDRVQLGQSCSSQTMVVDDASISIMGAIMSQKIQEVLNNGLPSNGEALFIKYDGKYSLSTEQLVVPESIKVKSVREKDWQVLLSRTAHDEMRRTMTGKTPKETGGVLLGSVFLFSKTIVVTDILKAPADSVEEESRFILGTEGLENKIKEIEKKTNGKVTYLGTWHTHPYGGGASQTDNKTFIKLIFVRNYEPTICLIITPDEIILV